MLTRKPNCAKCGFLQVRQVWGREEYDPGESPYRATYEPASSWFRRSTKELRQLVNEIAPNDSDPFRCALKTFDLAADVDETFDSSGTPAEWISVISRARDCHTFESHVPNMTIAAHSDRLKSRIEREQKREDQRWEILTTLIPYAMTGLAFIVGFSLGNVGRLSDAIDKINPF